MTTKSRMTLYQGSAENITVKLTVDGAKPDIAGWTFRAQWGRVRTPAIKMWVDGDITKDTTNDDYVLVTLPILDTDIVSAPRVDYILQIYGDDGTNERVLVDLFVELKDSLVVPS